MYLTGPGKSCPLSDWIAWPCPIFCRWTESGSAVPEGLLNYIWVRSTIVVHVLVLVVVVVVVVDDDDDDVVAVGCWLFACWLLDGDAGVIWRLPLLQATFMTATEKCGEISNGWSTYPPEK